MTRFSQYWVDPDAELQQIFEQEREIKGIKAPNKGFGKKGEPKQVAQRPRDRADKGYKYKR